MPNVSRPLITLLDIGRRLKYLKIARTVSPPCRLGLNMVNVPSHFTILAVIGIIERVTHGIPTIEIRILATNLVSLRPHIILTANVAIMITSRPARPTRRNRRGRRLGGTGHGRRKTVGNSGIADNEVYSVSKLVNFSHKTLGNTTRRRPVH